MNRGINSGIATIAANSDSTVEIGSIERSILINPTKGNDCRIEATTIDAIGVTTFVTGLDFQEFAINGKYFCREFQRQKRYEQR